MGAISTSIIAIITARVVMKIIDASSDTYFLMRCKKNRMLFEEYNKNIKESESWLSFLKDQKVSRSKVIMALRAQRKAEKAARKGALIDDTGGTEQRL